MSQQPLEPASDARLDENLSRLLQSKNDPPRLPHEAEARMLAALSARQSELSTINHQRKETIVSRVPHATTSPERVRGSYALVAALLLATIVTGTILWNRPQPKPDDLEQQATFPHAIRFETGKLIRQALDDGTIVIAQSGAKFKLTAPREISLDKGDLYLIVAHSDQPFVVSTDDGSVIATGTRFTVSAGRETMAAVAQGKVTLASGKGEVQLGAGEQGMLRRGERPSRRAAPRLSYLVSWAKEALSQEERLVEKNDSEDGLIAIDPWGQETRLSLRKYEIDVYIEDGIARTTIDQTFFNHHPWNSEGTFYFPLPPDASVSRLAMYVAGQLNEGGMVERGRGQQIYNDILHQRRDPALLEMMEGNVFKMRIFPLEGRQEKRIFLSYTQNLEELYGTLRYWLPMDHTHSIAGAMSIRIRVKNGARQFDPQSSTHLLESTIDGDDLVLTYGAEKVAPDQDLLLHLTRRGVLPATRVATCEQEGKSFVFARFTPEIPGAQQSQPRQWIVVNDVSASRSKIDVAAQRYILERLMAEADDDDSLFLINLNTRAEVLSQKFTPIRSAQSRSLLEHVAAPRLGATNLVAGMEAASKVIQQHRPANPHILYLGDGVATDGSTEAFEPVRAVPREAKFVGIGVGKKVDALFLQEAANRTGGMFATINPDEDIDWRVFDLVAALNTARLMKIEIQLQDAAGKPIKSIAYPSSRALAHGETLSVVARCETELPARILLSGQVNGKPYRSVAEVEPSAEAAAYLPRLWAKRHIDELLKSDMSREQEIVELSKHYYVVTPLTSLIVLEDDKMYAEYNVERGRKDHWALYPAPAKIEVVQEPVDWSRWGWYGWTTSEDQSIEAKTAPQSVREIVDSVQLRIDAPFYYWQPMTVNDNRYALYQTLDHSGPPAKSLAYWYLLAAGKQELAGEISPATRSAADTSAGTPPPASQPAPLFGFGYFNDEFSVPLFGSSSRKSSEIIPAFIFSRESLLGGELKKLAYSPMFRLDPSVMIGADRDNLTAFSSQAELTSLLSSTWTAPPALNFAADFQVGNQIFSANGIQPQLLTTFGRELNERWNRIDQELQKFNRNYGYWNSWGDSLDLTRSANTYWNGGLESLIESFDFELASDARARTVAPMWDMDFRGPRWPMTMGGGGRPTPVAMAWVGIVGASLKAVPGTSSVLAADTLVARRDALAKANRTPDEDHELAAIETALDHLGTAAARLEDTGPFWSHQGWDYRPQPWTFQPPVVQVYQNHNWSFDLTRYTPALQSNSFDILCEVVAQYGQPPAGKVEEDAAAIIAAARDARQPIKIHLSQDAEPLLVASGDRYALERRTDMYLTERIVCDGKQIMQQYEELGLAARRKATPLRLAAMRHLTPHLLEPAESLAARHNVRLAAQTIGQFTLELTPIDQENDTDTAVVVVVRADRQGRIHEKALFVDRKLQAKLSFTYEAGRVTAQWADGEGEELAKKSYEVEALDDETAFDCQLDDYVVFDMPLRKASYYAQLMLDDQKAAEFSDEQLGQQINLKRHQALALIQELDWRRWGGANDQAQSAMTQLLALCKQAGQSPKIGDLALLGSTGAYNAVELFKHQASVDASHPVAIYYQLRSAGWVDARRKTEANADGLTGHLAAFQACAWQYQVSDDFKYFAKKFPDSPLLLAATLNSSKWGEHPEAWATLYDNPRWQLLAIILAAPQLKTDEQRQTLAAAFAQMHAKLVEENIEVPVTSELLPILRSHEQGKLWQQIVADKLARAIDANDTSSLLVFAEQALNWGEREAADKALEHARTKLGQRPSLMGHLALAQTLWAGGRLSEALAQYDEILQQLKAKKIEPSPGLLSSVARLVQQTGDLARSVELEERAIAAEHAYIPDLINLQAFRQRYNWLWLQYQANVNNAVSQRNQAEIDRWLARAAVVWQQWHEIDPDNSDLASQMATLQVAVGNESDAWLYLSSVIDQHPRDAHSYYVVSQWYRNRQQLDDAQAWLAHAYKWDTANPRWLLERAQLLDQLDRRAEAKVLYQQIVDGEWANGLQGYVDQARQAL